MASFISRVSDRLQRTGFVNGARRLDSHRPLDSFGGHDVLSFEANLPALFRGGMGEDGALHSRAGSGPAGTPSVDAPLENEDRSQQGSFVSLRDVDKRFASRQVLSGISIDIAPGEFVAIVGRSGCGKSTLLRMIAGLESLEAGSESGTLDSKAPIAPTIMQDGEAGIGLNSHTRMMFQDARLLPWLRVADNVSLGLRKHERSGALGVLNSVGLEDRADDWPSVLSGGQRQRVALARALAHRPKLLLLDEPLGALDALTRIEMQVLIEKIWLREKFTALLVTHDVDEAITLADRVVLLDQGRIALDLRIELPRPRARGSVAFARYATEVLEYLLNESGATGLDSDFETDRPPIFLATHLAI